MGFFLINPSLASKRYRDPYNRQLEQQYPTTASLGNDILAATGSIEISSSASDINTVLKKQLILAINNAMARLWNANGWDWRINWASLYLEDEVMFYDLPFDFAWLNSPPEPLGQGSPELANITYEDLLRMVPGLHRSPDEVEEYELTVGQRAEIKAELLAQGHYGVSKYWFLRGNKIGFYPIPYDQSYQDANLGQLMIEGGDYKCGTYMMSFFSAPQRITALSSSTDIIIPPQFYNILVALGTAYFKHMIEQNDWKDYEARGERLMSLAVAGSRRIYPDNNYSDIRPRSTP